MHSKGIIHRDLKPENIMLEEDKNYKNCKLIDFGLSTKIKDQPETELMGTIYYIAPEVLKGSYNEKADIWSLGVLAFILLSGIPPFNSADDNEIQQLIR